MEQAIKISAVSYLNTKPFLHGLANPDLDLNVDLSLDIPSECARKLKSGEVDLGLVPVAIIPHLKEAHIISDYCIGAEGAVNTVCIYSEKPIDEIESLYLDYQSRTSVALTKHLVKHYWKISPQFIDAKEGFEEKIKETTAALIIGDRTIGLNSRYPFVYDLGEVWKRYTGLPFVFAAWVSNKKLPTSFIKQFNKALSFGVEKRDIVAQEFQVNYTNFSVKEYYNKYINYDLTADKRKALKLFLEYISSSKQAARV